MNFPRIVSSILNSTTINYSYRRFDARRFILHEIHALYLELGCRVSMNFSTGTFVVVFFDAATGAVGCLMRHWDWS